MERLLCEAIMTRAKPLAPRSIPVSVIVPTKNEEKNLQECLASLRWADEVFVVDSQSTDRTGDIARQYGATLVPFEYDGG
jgi:glycosyltransferase involved in cell wall biosynthesis